MWNEQTRVLSAYFECLIPNETMNTQLGNEMKLDENMFSFAVDKSISINPEPLHHTIRTRDSYERISYLSGVHRVGHTSIGHGPHNHVSSFKIERLRASICAISKRTIHSG